MDFYLPGCPPPADRIRAVLEALLNGEAPQLDKDQTPFRMKGRGYMAQRIVIDPVTRIEGHAKISIFLDDAGEVSDARFHVTEFRGFERFCEGRPFWEMAGLSARICGICPVSHLIASAKAGDRILAVDAAAGRARSCAG